MSDNEIYLLIKYIKSVLWRVAKRLSYIEEARCLKLKCGREAFGKNLAVCANVGNAPFSALSFDTLYFAGLF